MLTKIKSTTSSFKTSTVSRLLSSYCFDFTVTALNLCKCYKDRIGTYRSGWAVWSGRVFHHPSRGALPSTHRTPGCVPAAKWWHTSSVQGPGRTPRGPQQSDEHRGHEEGSACRHPLPLLLGGTPPHPQAAGLHKRWRWTVRQPNCGLKHVAAWAPSVSSLTWYFILPSLKSLSLCCLSRLSP